MRKLFCSVAGKLALTLTVSAVLLIAALNLFPPYFARRLNRFSAENYLLALGDSISAFLSDEFGEEGGSQIAPLLENPNLRMLIADGSGLVIYDSQTEHNKAGRLFLSESFDKAASGQVTFTSDYRPGRAFYYALTRPLDIVPSGGRSMVLSLMYTDSRLAAEYADMRRALIYVSAFAVPFFAAAIAWLYRRLSASTRSLLNGMDEIQQGNFTQRISVRGDSEFTQLGQSLNAICETFAATDEQRRRFVSDASHELKTPLASIKLLSDSIIQTPNMSREEINDFLLDISNEIDRLTRISSRLLSLAKFDDVDQAALAEELNLSAVAATVCRMLTPLARASNCTIRHELAERVMLVANYDSVYQIFYNLVENSIKYSGKDKEVRVFLYVRDAQAHFIVDDDGDGIPPDDLKKIFDRFYRVDKARARATGGTGLGLSIVASAVRACGGSVEAMNRKSGGARFVVRFPLPNQSGDPADSVPAEQAPENGGETV